MFAPLSRGDGWRGGGGEMAIKGRSFGAAFNFVISLSVCGGGVKLNGGGLRYLGRKRLQNEF